MLLHISVLMHTRLVVFYCDDVHIIWASQVTLVVKNQPANAGNIEMWVQSLGREDPWKRAWQPTPEFLPGESRHCLAAMTFLSLEGARAVRLCMGLVPVPSQFSSVVQSCPTLGDTMDCSVPGLPVHHQLPEPTQAHVHRVGDVIQPSHPLSAPSPPAFNISQHQGFFK